MKIKVEVEVPDGDTCFWTPETAPSLCSLATPQYGHWCSLFNGANVSDGRKCPACLQAPEAADE